MQLKTLLKLAMLATVASAAIMPRGGIGLGTMKKLEKKCHDIIKVNKSSYVDTCAQQDLHSPDARDDCVLDAILADASLECKEKLLEVLGVSGH